MYVLILFSKCIVIFSTASQQDESFGEIRFIRNGIIWAGGVTPDLLVANYLVIMIKMI
jgi:hypothetical protein